MQCCVLASENMASTSCVANTLVPKIRGFEAPIPFHGVWTDEQKSAENVAVKSTDELKSAWQTTARMVGVPCNRQWKNVQMIDYVK